MAIDPAVQHGRRVAGLGAQGGAEQKKDDCKKSRFHRQWKQRIY
jgi:hypothetical protein